MTFSAQVLACAELRHSARDLYRSALRLERRRRAALRAEPEVEDADRARMVELWRGVLRATSDYERGYYAGRFEEHADQNAISPDSFPAMRALAKAEELIQELQRRNAVITLGRSCTEAEQAELRAAYEARDALRGAAETLPRDSEGRCACGSTAGDEFHCADCGAEVL